MRTIQDGEVEKMTVIRKNPKCKGSGERVKLSENEARTRAVKCPVCARVMGVRPNANWTEATIPQHTTATPQNVEAAKAAAGEVGQLFQSDGQEEGTRLGPPKRE